MNYNILIGGAAGQGMDTLAELLEKILKSRGYEIFTIKDYMSRVRGGHNFIQIRFGIEELSSHIDTLDAIIALNKETIELHSDRLKSNGVIICDKEIISSDKELDKRIMSLPLKNIAREIGNRRVITTVALGALLNTFSIDTPNVEEVFNKVFNSEIKDINLKALNEGMKYSNSIIKATLPDNDANRNKLLINGNKAIALGALAAGCKFYSAYPMTPSTSIMNYMASKMNEAEVVVEQVEDEISAINMAIGASYAGVRAMTGTSGGGFSLMVEALGMAGIMETPLVVAEIQRPGPATGLPTRTEQSDLKGIIFASHGEFPRMVIAVKNPEDAFYQTVRAFNMADKYQIPVILVGDQFLADYTTTIEPFDFERVKIERHLAGEKDLQEGEYKRYSLTEDGISPRIIPGKIPGKVVLVDSDEHDEYGRITESSQVRIQMSDKRLNKMKLMEKDLIEPEFIGEEKFDILLLAWGSLDGPVKEAVRKMNESGKEKYGALIYGDIWPLPIKELKNKFKSAKKIINIEQNATGQLASLIMEATGIKCTSSILKYDGRPISSQEICERLGEGFYE